MTNRKPLTVRVYSFDFVDNHCGRWTRYYYATHAEAVEARRAMRAALPHPVDSYEFCGEYGEVTRVIRRGVEFTQSGIIAALNGADPNAE